MVLQNHNPIPLNTLSGDYTIIRQQNKTRKQILKTGAILLAALLFIGGAAASPSTGWTDTVKDIIPFIELPEGDYPDELDKIDTENISITDREPFLLTVVAQDEDSPVNPGDALNYEATASIDPSENIYCSQFHWDGVYYDTWIAVDTGGAIPWTDYDSTRETHFFPCTGESVEISKDFDAPGIGDSREQTFDIQLRQGTGDTEDDDEYVVADEDQFTVYEEITPPTADINVPSTVTVGGTVTVDASGSSGEELSYNWDIDGSSRTGEAISYSFDNEDFYTVELEVEDWQGQTDTASTTVQAEYQPVNARINADSESVEAGETVSLDASQSDGHDGVQSYEWIVDGQTVSQQEETEYVFDVEGSYTVELEVEDGAGQTDSTTTQVEVEVEEPFAELDVPESVDAGEEFELDGSPSSRGTYFIDEHSWTVNGDSLTGESTSYSFDQGVEGVYTVELTVVDTEGFSDSTSQEVEVQPVDEDDDEDSQDEDSDTDDSDDDGTGESDEENGDSQDEDTNGTDDDTDETGGEEENLLNWILNILFFR